MRHTWIAVPALLATVVLGGCQAAQDSARGVADDAACQAARSAVSGIEDTASSAIDSVGADPQAATRELKALRTAVAGAIASGLSADAESQLQEARSALDDLVAQAQQEASGTPVDPAKVAAAQDDLDAAVDGVGDAC